MTRALVALVILIASVGFALVLGRRGQTPLHERPGGTMPSAVVDPVPSAAIEGHADASAYPEGEAVVLPEPHPWSEALCPVGMVWVGGKRCLSDGNEDTGAHPCAQGEQEVSVCMDPSEYPSQLDVYPAVMLDYRFAQELCKAEGKRLCTDREWTFACSSTRDSKECNLGRTELSVRTQELGKPGRVSEEVARREGRRPNRETGCVNAFRVFDLRGNVQEWVTSERDSQYVGAVKGGRYNQGSIGCGRTIYVSDPWARYPHTGVRCCSDPLVPTPTRP